MVTLWFAMYWCSGGVLWWVKSEAAKRVVVRSSISNVFPLTLPATSPAPRRFSASNHNQKQTELLHTNDHNNKQTAYLLRSTLHSFHGIIQQYPQLCARRFRRGAFIHFVICRCLSIPASAPRNTNNTTNNNSILIFRR